MPIPKCVSLSIDFNAHVGIYQPLAQWLEEQEVINPDGPWFEWVSPEEREKAIRENSVWTCQWYPDTPVGFCAIAASSFEALMDALSRGAKDA